jgi:uncharacterized membrane-anchored protein YhcB (DUF1043 family)
LKENHVFPLESLFIVGIVMLIVGMIVGAVAGRAWIAPEQTKEIEHKLSEAKRELEQYQQGVAEHFSETAQKVRELTQSYKELHEHLALGAMQLTNTEIGRQLFAAGENDGGEKAVFSQTTIEPPRDWAPKIPGSHGMLSEEFGLKDEDEALALIDGVPPVEKKRGGGTEQEKSLYVGKSV